jgi:hypothetical protein
MNGFARNCLNRARRPRPWDTDTGPILPGEPYRLEAARAVSQGGEAAADTAQVVRRRHLQLDAYRANRVLLTTVAHL